MATKTNEIDVWQNLTPVINMVSDGEFDVWQNLTPVEDIDGSSETPSTTTRRRVMIY